MTIRKLTLEELEELSMVDIAHEILQKSDKNIKIQTIFTKISKLLKLTESEAENKIGDFYTAISTDKRFVVLENGKLDLKAKHSVQKVKVAEETDDDALDFIVEEEIVEEKPEKEEEEYNSTLDDDKDGYNENEDLKDLVILEEEDLDS